MFLVPYIKGFEINCEKLIEDFGREMLTRCIKIILEKNVDWDGRRTVSNTWLVDIDRTNP
jgi:hypothetical protein